MVYRVLLAGTHSGCIEDVFSKMEEHFLCITSSMRKMDLIRHVQSFRPDLFILCLKSETAEEMDSMAEVKAECEKVNTVFIILGDEKDCETFKQRTGYVADLSLIKPTTHTRMVSEIEYYLSQRRAIEEGVLEEDRRHRAELGDESPIPTGIYAKEELIPPPPKKHILVVDDDANMLKLIKHYLEEEYEVATALNGKLAVRFLSKRSTDLLLLDYEMPEGSGDEVLAAIRNFEKTKDIPVVFLTGVTNPEKIKKVMAFHPQGYLLKPIEQQKLLDAVREHIS